MKTEPNVGDIVWTYIYDRLWKCKVESRSAFGNVEPCYNLIPEDEDDKKLHDHFLLQARYFFYNARDAINAEIKFTNTNIKENKQELDLRRQTIKELKIRRANLQRMLECYPK